MAYEKLRELLDNWRREDPKHDEKLSNELMKEINGTALEMQSTVTWHKYPDKKPEFDKPLLLWDEKDVFEGHYLRPIHPDNKWKEQFSANDTSRCDDYAVVYGIKAWAYMPEGPN